MDGVLDLSSPARFAPYTISKCAGFCRSRGAALNAITPAFACHCINEIPSEDARAPDSACSDKGDGAALFYNHLNVDDASCRLANVPMEKSSFNFHYNDYHATFDNGVMTTKMVRPLGGGGTAWGARPDALDSAQRRGMAWQGT